MTFGPPAPSWTERVRRWFRLVQAPNPVGRRHAPSILVLSGLGSVALVVGEVVRFLSGAVGRDLAVFSMRIVGAIVLAGAFWLVRAGRFKAGVTLFVSGAVLISAVGVALSGFAANAPSLPELAMPLALAALLVGRRALWLSMSAYALGFTVGGLRDAGHLWSTGPHAPPTLPFGAVGTAIIAFTVVSIVLDRVGLSLREGFELALARQRELEQASQELMQANAVLRDEMARRQSAEAHLVQAQKMEAVSRLSGGVAHDFNNLLTVILGSEQIARDSLPAGHVAQDGLTDIREAAERAADLTRQLLAFGRRGLVEPQRLSLDERVRSTQKLLVRLLPENIQVRTELTTREWQVLVDPGQLDQVIVNLAVNARDAMPLGGSIAIRTRETTCGANDSFGAFAVAAGDYLILEVEDRGTGMAPEVARRVFEPFFTTKGGTSGTGLGLATCHGIVSQAGGTIVFDTEPGRGTTFRVYLPRAAPLAVTPARERPASVRPGRGETVLVVEDEPAVRRVMRTVLRRAGYQVLEATNLAQALAVASDGSARVDLLLTDLVLPDGTGGEVAQQVTELRPELRVLFISGHTDDPVLRRGISESDVDFVRKPFTADGLAARVAEVLARPARRLFGAQSPSSPA